MILLMVMMIFFNFNLTMVSLMISSNLSDDDYFDNKYDDDVCHLLHRDAAISVKINHAVVVVPEFIKMLW